MFSTVLLIFSFVAGKIIGGESCADEFQKHELSKKLARKTYLITYSRTNESICPVRETFSPANIRFISSK